ncbi:hypothetical protein [Brumimicrobium mesophilum]|uniref:hypothetical protein n=1 Tax=Brumimicrobium mesophilum TaxID=392717 RepID=UPI00131E5714|nr:hypothetical protein [Brumimicrobium mesophilum]
MKRIINLIILLSISTHLLSQIDSTKVPFVSYWSIGDSYDFKISKIRQQWKEGKQTKDEKQEYIANFTVIDSTESSYTIIWSYENDLINSYDIPENLMDRFSKYETVAIKYKTSEVGDIIEVINWKEVSDIMISMFDDMIEILGENDEVKKEALRSALDPFKQAYSSKDGVEQLALKELQYFHFPLGVEFDITEPLFYEEELPNMFGGKPIKAKSKIYFENVDFENDFCVLKQEMNLDPKDTKQIIQQVFKQMNLNDKEMKNALKTSVLEINDRNIYEYYFYPGVPHRIETKRESVINIDKEKARRIDKIIIELIYDEE